MHALTTRKPHTRWESIYIFGSVFQALRLWSHTVHTFFFPLLMYLENGPLEIGEWDRQASKTGAKTSGKNERRLGREGEVIPSVSTCNIFPSRTACLSYAPTI